MIQHCLISVNNIVGLFVISAESNTLLTMEKFAAVRLHEELIEAGVRPLRKPALLAARRVTQVHRSYIGPSS